MKSIKNIRYDCDVNDITTANYTSVMPVQNTLLAYTRKKKKLRGLSPRANYTDRAAAAGRRS